MNDSTAQGEPTRKLASDDDRRRVADELSAALGRGQLQFDEFEERSTTAWSCRYRDELIPLLADVHDSPEIIAGLRPDLPAQPPPGGAVPFAAESGSVSPTPLNTRSAVDRMRGRITGERDGSRFSLSMMGGATRNGDWLCADSHTSITVMGGNEVDLREARLESGHIRIVAFAVMGGVDVIVPEGVRVVCDGIGVMGGFDTEIAKTTAVRPAALPADAPVVQVSGLAVLPREVVNSVST